MKRKLVIATVTAAALLGGGGAVAFADEDGQARQSSVQDDDSRGDDGSRDDDGRNDDSRENDRGDDAREAADAGTTAAEAAAAAQKAAPGTVTSIDLSGGKQAAVWEVDLTEGSTSHEVRLDAGTNKVLGDKTEPEDEDVPRSGLSAAEVADKAAARGTVTAVEFDGAVWEVETTDKNGKEAEFSVDASSGKVSASASDDDGDDRGKDDADDDGRDDDRGGDRHGDDDGRDDD
ncbi:PepSY domain-containing protein [Streptomyces winkii]|uniref:PepSY domain-containing protein n=1 Tax=Streptomyces winkii TaxID=3051178 RepID=UPI0028D5E95D|nr:PepSY domain-containing protein [Streptomyces sp. DSM 40971]